MRSIRGWIRNLSDGLGPPAGTVGVSAKPTVDNVELDNTTHETGVLTRVHIAGGSGSASLADPLGHFGWDMELSPGPINVQLTPTDPQTEFRWRFPDESAQYGKAFLSDLERLGWAAGKDCVIWDAVFGGHNPASAESWSNNPTATWGQGNWSIAAFGSGADAMKVVLRKGISFLGGVPFTVEAADITVPVAGESALPANASGQDRWDLLSARIDIDPSSDTYGKQTFEMLQGTPGTGVPADPGQVAGVRRMALHALKTVSGSGVYSDAFDLRRWHVRPRGGSLELSVATDPANQKQVFNNATKDIPKDSILNTLLATQEMILPMDTAWEGTATWSGRIKHLEDKHSHLLVDIQTEGRGVTDTLIEGSNYTLGDPFQVPNHGGSAVEPILRIPSYGTSALQSPSRAWHRLRFKVMLTADNPTLDVINQRLTVQLRQVP